MKYLLLAAIALVILAAAEALLPDGRALTISECRADISAAAAIRDAEQRNLAFIALVGSLNDVLQVCAGDDCAVARQCLREAMGVWPQER